jgi:hypothetical protein
MKAFNIRMNNHEEHEGHEEKCVKNFVFSATAPCVAYMDVGKGREQEAEASPKAPTVGALDCCSRRNSTSPILGVVPPASMQSSVFFVVNIAFGVS